MMKTKFFMPNFLWYFYKGNFEASYPFATLNLFESYLTISINTPSWMMFKNKMEYRIEYKNIDYFTKTFIYLRIYHHDSENSSYIYILGPAGVGDILSKIKKSIIENNLPLTIKE